MHGNEVFQRVRHALAQVEAERNVRVLFACESGSRAWGFASRDSDYDVRFLYVHRRDWYLSVEEPVRPPSHSPSRIDLDVSGGELRKALRLLRKSNPPLLEWLKSPVVYRHDPVFAAEFGALATEFYSRRRCFAHYLHMAFGNWRDYLRLARPPTAASPLRLLGGREEVSLKKYLYVFCLLLASASSATCRCSSRNSWRACSTKPTCAPRSRNASRASRPATSWLSRRRSKRSCASSRPNCQGSKRSTSPMMPLAKWKELTGFFRRYALAA
jgi:predicted nucleotidyltransferase